MPDDRVRIDPQFQPSSSREGRDRLLWLAGISALAAAAFLLGWLTRTPTPLDPEAWDPIRTTTTTAAMPSTTTLRTTSTTVPEPDEMVGFSAPLGEAVPGFTDTVTLEVFTDHGDGTSLHLLRWRPSERDPEAIVSFRLGDDDGEQGWFAGMDVTGMWYALHDPYGVLSVRRVAPEADDDGWMDPAREAVGIRVRSLGWHDAEPGRLAWMSCPRGPGGEATLFTLDVTDHLAEPVPVVDLEGMCGGSEYGGPWIEGWGEWGFALGSEGGGGELGPWAVSTILLDPDGGELTRFETEPHGTHMVAGDTAGTIWTEHGEEQASSFLLSPDGRRRSPPPGMEDGEWIGDAWWSPDGSMIALAIGGTGGDDGAIGVVDAVTGEAVAETGEWAWPVCWSTDGRFLLYGRNPWWGGSEDAALVVFDVAASTIVAEVPLPEGHHLGEIRTVDPSSVAGVMTPVDWGITPEEPPREPAVYTIRMIVDVPYPVPDQIEDLSGKLVWETTEVELCNIGIRDEGPALRIGDIFQTTEGCGDDPRAMQDAVNAFGLPHTGCLSLRASGLDHEFCGGFD